MAPKQDNKKRKLADIVAAGVAAAQLIKVDCTDVMLKNDDESIVVAKMYTIPSRSAAVGLAQHFRAAYGEFMSGASDDAPAFIIKNSWVLAVGNAQPYTNAFRSMAPLTQRIVESIENSHLTSSEDVILCASMLEEHLAEKAVFTAKAPVAIDEASLHAMFEAIAAAREQFICKIEKPRAKPFAATSQPATPTD